MPVQQIFCESAAGARHRWGAGKTHMPSQSLCFTNVTAHFAKTLLVAAPLKDLTITLL